MLAPQIPHFFQSAAVGQLANPQSATSLRHLDDGQSYLVTDNAVLFLSQVACLAPLVPRIMFAMQWKLLNTMEETR